MDVLVRPTWTWASGVEGRLALSPILSRGKTECVSRRLFGGDVHGVAKSARRQLNVGGAVSDRGRGVGTAFVGGTRTDPSR